MSLRQSLTAIRRSTEGAPFLQIGRTALALDPSKIDIRLASGSLVLRGHTEPWFTVLRASETAARRSLRQDSPENTAEASVQALGQLLRWTIAHQPNNAFGILYHLIDVAVNLPPTQALELSEELLHVGALNHPQRGWGNFLHAWALFFCNETEVASRKFHEVRKAALVQGKGELLSLAAFYEIGCLLPLGRIAQAEAIVAQFAKVDVGHMRPRGQVRMIHSRGLTASCKANFDDGFSFLRQAVELAATHSDAFEEAYAAVNLAWMASSVGRDETARWALRRFTDANTGGSWRFAFTAALAQVNLGCSEGEVHAAIEQGQDYGARAATIAALGFETYFRESLARCHLALGDFNEAEREFDQAKECRAGNGWALNPWDEVRFARLLTLTKLRSPT